MALCGLAWIAAPALADRRVTLVIGNAAYKHADPLRNPVNDAIALGAAFERLKNWDDPNNRLDADFRRDLQRRLKDAGLYDGPIDGNFDVGSPARRALEQPRKAQVAIAVPDSRAYRPGETFRDCADCPEMVVVPAGAFMMGSPASEKERRYNEGPQHQVTIAKPFAVGKFEVTFAEWDACVTAGGCSHRPSDVSWGRGRRPVINVSWNDSQGYTAWLSKKTGKTYRLLTEAEWEYAARAGTMTPFSTGATISTDQANYDGNYTYGSGKKGQYRRRTVEVGSFQANEFGLHDVHGNVREWVQDCYQSSYAGAPTDGRSVADASRCRRVVRGGYWLNIPQNIRSASRDGTHPDLRSGVGGFRLARTLNP